jgi:hypothetical protein
MFKNNKIETYKWGFPKPRVLFNIVLTFTLVTVGLIIFRAETVGQIFKYFGGIMDKSLLSLPILEGMKKVSLYNIIFIACMLIVEWIGRNEQFGLEKLGLTWKPIYRYAMYYVIILLIFLFAGQEQEFIYFQF